MLTEIVHTAYGNYVDPVAQEILDKIAVLAKESPKFTEGNLTMHTMPNGLFFTMMKKEEKKVVLAFTAKGPSVRIFSASGSPFSNFSKYQKEGVESFGEKAFEKKGEYGSDMVEFILENVVKYPRHFWRMAEKCMQKLNPKSPFAQLAPCKDVDDVARFFKDLKSILDVERTKTGDDPAKIKDVNGKIPLALFEEQWDTVKMVCVMEQWALNFQANPEMLEILQLCDIFVEWTTFENGIWGLNGRLEVLLPLIKNDDGQEMMEVTPEVQAAKVEHLLPLVRDVMPGSTKIDRLLNYGKGRMPPVPINTVIMQYFIKYATTEKLQYIANECRVVVEEKVHELELQRDRSLLLQAPYSLSEDKVFSMIPGLRNDIDSFERFYRTGAYDPIKGGFYEYTLRTLHNRLAQAVKDLPYLEKLSAIMGQLEAYVAEGKDTLELETPIQALRVLRNEKQESVHFELLPETTVEESKAMVTELLYRIRPCSLNYPVEESLDEALAGSKRPRS